jgi:hypothetical protein
MTDSKIEILDLSKNSIKNKIYTIRGIQVMLDRDLAELYEIETRNLNKAVQRNIKRFPSDFMFELTLDEFKNLMWQNGTSSWGGTRKSPKVFTEIGVATLSGILQSNIAIEANIKIMRAFVEMRHFLITNALIFQKLDSFEQKQLQQESKIEEIFNALENKPPKHGVFFEGQVFDAYKFVALLTKRQKNVTATIFTKNISKELLIDLKKHNAQYPEIKIKEFNKSHDRFLILDDTEVYLFGSSLKDLGTKWFGFSKIEIESFKIIEKIKNLK